MQAFHIIVSGRVQGVCYRAATQAEAARLGLTGYARNLADGRVEIVAQGNADLLTQLVAWCWHGPGLARVTAVATQPIAVNPLYTDFTIRG